MSKHFNLRLVNKRAPARFFWLKIRPNTGSALRFCHALFPDFQIRNTVTSLKLTGTLQGKRVHFHFDKRNPDWIENLIYVLKPYVRRL